MPIPPNKPGPRPAPAPLKPPSVAAKPQPRGPVPAVSTQPVIKRPLARSTGRVTSPVKSRVPASAQRDQDVSLLRLLLADGNVNKLSTGEQKAFLDMHTNLKGQEGTILAGSQRRWLAQVWHRIRPMPAAPTTKATPPPPPKAEVKPPAKPTVENLRQVTQQARSLPAQTPPAMPAGPTPKALQPPSPAPAQAAEEAKAPPTDKT